MSFNRTCSFVLILACLMLAGCGYTGNVEIQHHVYQAQLHAVQEAVDEFQKDKGILPIKNSTMTTPIYIKYPIDFRRLQAYLPDAPDNAFQNGGIYEYVLVDVERNPTVKVVDLTTLEKVREVQRRVNAYWYEHHFAPLGKVIVPKRYTIDYEALGYDETPMVTSPFTGHLLGFVMDADVDVSIDYRQDLYAFLNKYGGDFETGEDIREMLVNHSPFVPAESVPYTIDANGEPVFLVK
ncbi:MAG TPA: hypothetical protein VFK44_12845 [Bacillales bacterium]|nr:hypothetical protein [Bacillales bacterium]